MNQKLHDKAWDLLTENGVSLADKLIIRNSFEATYKDDYPFISSTHEKGKIKYYFSDIDAIKNLMFETENEVIMANAIYENVKDKFNPNEFIQQLKFTFKILGIQSKWNP